MAPRTVRANAVERLAFGSDIPLLGTWATAGYTQEEAPALSKVGNLVRASGVLTKPAGVAPSTTFAVIPVGWRPRSNLILPVATQKNGAPYTIAEAVLYVNARDPEDPEALGSDDSGYGIMYLQVLGSSPATGDVTWLFLSTAWDAES